MISAIGGSLNRNAPLWQGRRANDAIVSAVILVTAYNITLRKFRAIRGWPTIPHHTQCGVKRDNNDSKIIGSV